MMVPPVLNPKANASSPFNIVNNISFVSSVFSQDGKDEEEETRGSTGSSASICFPDICAVIRDEHM